MELSKPLILVADDEAESLRLLTSILRTEGYEVAASDSGDLALASAAAQTPDLILLDLRMPGMDGLEVCRRLKQSEATRETPLMFISGSSDTESRVEGLAVGAVDFVTKPFQREELLARVRTHLELGRLRANLEKEVAQRTAELESALEQLRQSEQALRVSETRLASGADLAGLGFYEVDFGEDSTYVDERMCDVCGIPSDPNQVVPGLQFWMDQLHPADRPRVVEERHKLYEGTRERLSVEYRYLHPARGQRWIDHQESVAARDATGHALHAYGVLRDVTERRQAEEDLRQSYAEIERLKERLEAESDYLKAEMRATQPHGDIAGKSAGILQVLRKVEQVAPTDASVLVRGETGTGKELIAQAVHRLSLRRNHVMVKVNCAALPSGLVESELFGREKGAFTGALTRQAGRFEVADGSTIFLDEVGELSLEVQAKLLRVLESGEFERLGSSRTLQVNVRLVAATNRDLIEAVRQGKFREDLYYRLNVFPIHVPPLRDRAEDIPLLVWAFLEDFSSRMGKKISQVPRKTMEALQRHSWPGNVRELRNVIEHGTIISEGDTLRIPILEKSASLAAPGPTLEEAEREHILRVLNRTGWHVKGPRGAALELGLKPATLYSRMEKLGIQPRLRAESSAV